jgi:hypothetical protein
MGEMKSVYRVLVGKPEGKRPLGINRRRLYDNIKVDLWEVGWEAWAEIFDSGYGQLTGTCKHGNEPSGSKKCGDFLD